MTALGEALSGVARFEEQMRELAAGADRVANGAELLARARKREGLRTPRRVMKATRAARSSAWATVHHATKLRKNLEYLSRWIAEAAEGVGVSLGED